MAGLVAAFVFAAQMLNFPVAAGTSGHLLGGALAAVLAGPYTAVLAMTVVLLIQALLFADGGLTALGVNIVLMGIVTAASAGRCSGSWSGCCRAAAPRSWPGRSPARSSRCPPRPSCSRCCSGSAAPPPIEVGTVAAAMGGVHVLIGIGEAVITALTVSSVLAVRPDLVYGARHLATPLVLRGADGTTRTAEPAAPQAAPARPRRLAPFGLAALAVSLLLAGVVSFYASGDPDGLERVAADHGFDAAEREHDLAGSPLADYGVAGVANERLSVGLAGIIGVGVTVAVGGAVCYAARRRTKDETGTAEAPDRARA